MEQCPVCRRSLERTRTESGNVFVCATCGGLMATLAVLRRIVARETINAVWQRVRQAVDEGKATSLASRLCPTCSQPMVLTPSCSTENKVMLDVCMRCQLIWLDAEELERLPARPPEPQPPPEKPLSPEAAEAMGLAMLESVMKRQQMQDEAEQLLVGRRSLGHGRVGLVGDVVGMLLRAWLRG